MKKLLVLGLAALLSSCKPVSPDGYTFEKAQYVQTDLRVTVVPVATQSELIAMAPASAKSSKVELMAWGKLSADRRSCTIYFVDAQKRYQPQWIGHELTHCIYGEWHPQQNAERK